MFLSQRFFARGVFALVVVFAAFVFMGCPAEEDDAGNLSGVWTNNSQGYITTIKIDTSAKTIKYEGSYEGRIANSPDFTAANGVLIIQFTKYWEWIEENGEWSSAENPDSDCINQYGALYWRDLTPNTVYMADAYTDYVHTMFETFEEAQANFTMNNVSIDWSIVGIYTK